jgi:NNP family nitrate/nitrite transporter-like MFS transporter
VAWRVAFIIPFILIISTALGMIFFCPDTPTGKWSERHLHTAQLLSAQGVGTRTDSKGVIMDEGSNSGVSTPRVDEEKGTKPLPPITHNPEARLREGEMIEIAQGEVILKPTFKEGMKVFFSLQTLFHCATYFCSFGGELAINSYLGAYYLKNFPHLGQTGSGRWAAMFGLLNVVTRPLGGVIGDVIYKYNKSLWAKKAWILFVGIISGAFLVAIGLTDPHEEAKLFGLIAGMAVFLEAGNGANFALVPHVHPHANGILSGITGAAGNFGGVIFAILFRFHGTDYAESFWICGVMIMALNISVSWIRPVPKGQIGGR